MAGLSFPAITNPNCKAQSGFDTLRLASIDSNRNRELKKLTTQRMVTKSIRADTVTAATVDVRQGLIFNNLDALDEGVRIYDVRMGNERYSFSQRQVCFENVFGIFVPEAWLAPRPPQLPGDPGDQIGFWGRVVNNFEGLGYTSGTNGNFPGSNFLTMPDSGVYGVRFLMEVDPLPFDSNFQDSTFNLSFIVRFYSGVEYGLTSKLLHEFPVQIQAGTELLRTTVDDSISAAIGNNALSIDIGGGFVSVTIPDGNYPTLASINLELASSLTTTFGGTWTVSTNPMTLITLITYDAVANWDLDPLVPVANPAPNLANILGFTGNLVLTASGGQLFGTLPAVAPDIIQPPAFDVQTGFVCSLNPNTPLFVRVENVIMDPQISESIGNNALSISLDGLVYVLVTIPDGPYVTAEDLDAALQAALITEFGGVWSVTTGMLGQSVIEFTDPFYIDTDAVGGSGLATIYGFSGGILGPATQFTSTDPLQLPFSLWFPSNANIRISMIAAL